MTHGQQERKNLIFWFFASQCVTLFGSQIVQMAVVWYVTLQTNSGAWIAAFSVCSYLPQFFVSFIGGVWADRYNRKRLILGADLLIAAVTAMVALILPCMSTDSDLLGALLLMALIRSAGAGIQNPAVQASIPLFVAKEELTHYNGIYAAMQAVVQFGAPAVAAVVMSMGTFRSALLMDVWTALIGVAMLARVRFPGQGRATAARSVLADIGEGIRYAYARATVAKTLMLYAAFVFFTVPAGYLAGLMVSRVFGDTYGYLTAVELVGFGGMLLGGLVMSRWSGFRARRRTLALGLGVFGAMAIGMGISRRFVVYLICMALYGVSLTVVQTTLTTILQTCTQSAMQGRVFGLMSSLYASCYPLGMALFGPLADVFPIRWIMALSGVVLMLSGVMAGRDRDFESGIQEDPGDAG